ncbi:MAG: hypothetical protein LBB15_03030 [Puniceicoccales bacterium]|jgi:hypothetical protein|nr:hypothetical protein [Puniceicoccales bacterium]
MEDFVSDMEIFKPQYERERASADGARQCAFQVVDNQYNNVMNGRKKPPEEDFLNCFLPR